MALPVRGNGPVNGNGPIDCNDIASICSHLADFAIGALRVVGSFFVAICNEGRRHDYMEVFNDEDWSAGKVQRFVCDLKKEDRDLFYFLIGKVTESHLLFSRVRDVFADVLARNMPSDMQRFERYLQLPGRDPYVSETIEQGERYFLRHEMDPKVINIVRALSLWAACKSPRLE